MTSRALPMMLASLVLPAVACGPSIMPPGSDAGSVGDAGMGAMPDAAMASTEHEIVEIAAGSTITVVRTADGRVWFRGSHEGDGRPFHDALAEVSGVSDPIAIAALRHSNLDIIAGCALESDGDVRCFNTDRAAPTSAHLVGTVAGGTSIAIGGAGLPVCVVVPHPFAGQRFGDLHCVAAGATWYSGPATFSEVHSEVESAAGGHSTLLLVESMGLDPRVFADPTMPDHYEYGRLPIDPSNAVDAIDSNGLSCIVVGAPGQVRCVSNVDDSPPAGDGSEGLTTDAVVVSGIDDAIDVASAQSATCVLRASGNVACWGMGGRLSPARSLTPVEVPGLTDAVQITAGVGHFCALRATGALECWGNEHDRDAWSDTRETVAFP